MCCTSYVSWINKKNINTFWLKEKCVLFEKRRFQVTKVACLFTKIQKVCVVGDGVGDEGEGAQRRKGWQILRKTLLYF